jgi:glycosyltransferase involved in cell wall biosynthesis
MSHPARRALGAFAYPPGAVVHRMDLTLPPARTEVLTIHDTVAWRYPDEGNPSPAVLDEIRAAAAVICVSRNTANDLAALTGRQDAIVVHPGVDARFVGAAPLDAPTRSALGITGDYILHAGGASTRKNLEGLAEAWSIVESSVPEVSLVLAGPPHSRRDALFGGLPRVRRLGRVPDAAVPGLVAGAAVVVVPSHYEGFGLPVVEAMAAGTPVVVAKTSSLVEVGGDVAIMVEPDGASIAAGIFAALSSGFDREQYRVRASKRAATFDWDESVSRIAQVWRDVAASA